MAKTPKFDKKDRKALKEPDEFVKKGSSILDFFVEHRSRFFPVAIGAVVIVLGAYAYDWWDNDRLEKAWTEFHKIEKLSENEKILALEKFSGSGLRPSMMASAALGDHFFDEAKKESLADSQIKEAAKKSADWYAKALNFGGLQPMEKQLLLVDRGKALEMAGDYELALGEFQKAFALGGEGKAIAELNRGRVFELKGQTAEAVKSYESVISEFTDTEYAKQARAYLRVLKTHGKKLPG